MPTSVSAFTKTLAYNLTMFCTNTACMCPGRAVTFGLSSASKQGLASLKYLHNQNNTCMDYKLEIVEKISIFFTFILQTCQDKTCLYRHVRSCPITEYYFKPWRTIGQW